MTEPHADRVGPAGLMTEVTHRAEENGIEVIASYDVDSKMVIVVDVESGNEACFACLRPVENARIPGEVVGGPLRVGLCSFCIEELRAFQEQFV